MASDDDMVGRIIGRVEIAIKRALLTPPPPERRTPVRRGPHGCGFLPIWRSALLERAPYRRAAAGVVWAPSDQNRCLRVFVGAATGDRSRSGARAVPARSGWSCSGAMGSKPVPFVSSWAL